MDVLEAFAGRLIGAKRTLLSNRSIARAFRAVERRKSFDAMDLHERMLADSVRLEAYYAAIQRYVSAQDCVVDIGTGTGILAFFAASKRPRKIYAIDVSKTMLDYAGAAATANGIGGVTFVASSSRKFQPEEPIDVLLQEQMGVALFDEGMIDSILDVRDRCLKPGGRILPNKFDFHLEPVQLREQERVPMIQEQRLYGVGFPLPVTAPERAYYFREIRPEQIEFLLCDPHPVFTFDLSTLTREALPKNFSVSKPVVRRGRLDGICMYFKATFGSDISFSTGPDARRTHWPMPLYRTLALDCSPGEIFTMQVETPDLANYLDWTWNIGSRGNSSAESGRV
jgi:protein arginine N-methyltransferase 1